VSKFVETKEEAIEEIEYLLESAKHGELSYRDVYGAVPALEFTIGYMGGGK
jgi:hypothetical protein